MIKEEIKRRRQKTEIVREKEGHTQRGREERKATDESQKKLQI